MKATERSAIKKNGMERNITELQRKERLIRRLQQDKKVAVKIVGTVMKKSIFDMEEFSDLIQY